MSKEEEDYQRYRYLVLFHLPHLKFLDSRPVTPAVRAEWPVVIPSPWHSPYMSQNHNAIRC
jgi:hypothetical protein